MADIVLFVFLERKLNYFYQFMSYFGDTDEIKKKIVIRRETR